MERQESFSKLHRAKNRVEKLKKFYNHLGIFVVVNLVITGFKLSDSLSSWDEFTNELLSIDVLSVWVVWGAILAIHAFSVFIFPVILGYDWEERKIEKLMEEELKSKENNHGKV